MGAAAVAFPPDDIETLQTDWLDRVRFYMEVISDHTFAGTEVAQVLDDAVGTRGKMIRPRLLLISGAFGPFAKLKREKLCMLAAMVELTHLASLIHDDIVDEAPLRRGKHSIQSRYGKDAAVYAGDFLMARINYYEAKEQLNEGAKILSAAIEQMCTGEIGQAMCRYREDVTKEQYLKNIRGKTTALFEAACRIGATESGCTADVTDTLTKIGANLGVMFQLRDDLLDFTGKLHVLGKETHKDFRSGIYTMPVLMALESEEGRKKLLPVIRDNRERVLSDKEIAGMEQTVIDQGGTERTREEIRAYGAMIGELLGSFEDHPAAGILAGIVRKLEV